MTQLICVICGLPLLQMRLQAAGNHLGILIAGEVVVFARQRLQTQIEGAAVIRLIG